MSAAILHLSDIHIKGDSDRILKLNKSISSSIKTDLDLNSVTQLFIVCTGDIAYSGQNEQYKLGGIFLKELRSFLEKAIVDIEVSFITCPGNHDCDFSNEEVRSYILEKVKDEGIDQVPDEIKESCLSHQDNYFEFQQGLEGEPLDNKLLWRKVYSVSNKKLIFTQINTAWCSTLSETQGQLSYPFKNVVYDDGEINITMMHHPSNWFSQTTLNEFRDFALKSTDILLTGHEHMGSSSTVISTRSQRFEVIEGGVLQDGSENKSSFNLLLIDLDNSILEYSRFEFDEACCCFTQGEKFKRDLVSGDGGNFLAIASFFEDFISDCGGYFKHPSGMNMKLRDIFVAPVLSKEDDDGNSRPFNTSGFLSDVTMLEKNCIISGGDNVGLTSLLRMMAYEYIKQGYFLVFLSGADLKSSNNKNILNLILRKASSQYESNNVKEYYRNIDVSKRILIVDDFDESSVKSEHGRNEIVNYLTRNFGRVILGVDDTFSINELTSDIETKISSFDHYKIQFFGYKKRGELIRKWYELGRDDDTSDAEVVANCTLAERLIETAMDPSLISSCPIYIITLLQGIESNNSSDLKNASLGDYYRYLLTQSYLDVGVDREGLRVEIDYASHLANYMDSNGLKIVTEEEFIEFNDCFSRTWHESDFSKKLKTLLNSKVLVEVSDGYRFRYSYNYYYLIAYYFSKNILDPDIQKRVKNCIEHLYLKSNANTILFLSQQTGYDNIVVMMKNALCSLFEGRKVADLSDRCGVAQELIVNAPALKLDSSNPKQVREKSNELRDQSDSRLVEGHVMEKEKKKNISQLDLADRMSMLFRGMEILTQIIKSNPTNYERVKKVEVLKSIISEPLRALQDFYDHLEAHPRALIDAINHAVSQKSSELTTDQIDKLSRSVVARIVQGVSASFLIKTAHTLNSDVIKPEMATVIPKDSPISQTLISLAISLDSSRDLPREKLNRVFELCKDSGIALKVFEVIIFNRLHSYKTKAGDLQWLNESFDFSLFSQKAVAFNNARKISKGKV